GRAPALAAIERVKADGKDADGKMPAYGWTPVTVPGAPKAWAELVRRFGRLTLAEDLAPAAKYAREGYPAGPNLSFIWKNALRIYSRYKDDPSFAAWFDTFAPGGKVPEAGELVKLPHHADTLEEIGATWADSFYSGELAKKIDAESRRFGGYLRCEDMAAHKADWVEPISVNYRGYDVCEIPPNGQGIVCLMALNILKEFEFKERDSAETFHRQIEAMKMAFADAFRYVTDPACMEIDYRDLIRPEYGAMRAAEMTGRAQVWTHGLPPKSGTVYLCAADGEGNMVSFIQSNYNGFGSGMVIPGTGIALQNRGADFSLDPAAANSLQPGKRSYHTIIPGFLMQGGKPVGPFGVMGAYMQPQGHLQVVTNAIDFHLDPQQCLNAPRWQWLRDGSVIVESGFDAKIIEELRQKGHEIRVESSNHAFGRGQMIVRLENGALTGGTEPRTDSNIACF
ncbi:MAG: gamma-glutamyltransferase family protein, partial [Firmicutes bacterium]|nr:gamma-glutamyltransferase family protein [Bacillota bacterium]